MTTIRTFLLVMLGFAAAVAINFGVLPGDHLVSSLYLLPVLLACHVWRPRAVAITAAAAALIYVASALVEDRPLTVWPFGVLAFVIGGYLTVQFSLQREEIARHARLESEERQRLQVFMGMVAHDLAGSVTNIMAGAEMLAESPDRRTEESNRVAVAAINSGTGQARRLLTDLRDAAAIGAGQFDVAPARMDLVELAKDVVEEHRLGNVGHTIVLDAPDRLAGDWDRDRVGQLLSNLVSNACKYSSAGSQVLVLVREWTGGATIGVRDQGVGIDPAQHARIFEPFARVARGDDVPGTGLGLWISKAIAESHGGRISVESATHEGSSFTVILPSAGNVTAEHDAAQGAGSRIDAVERSARAAGATHHRPSLVVAGPHATYPMEP